MQNQSMDNQPIVAVRGLHKSFQGRPALKDVSFQVERGEIFCLLGPNGAGKSTTINIMSTALQADAGEVLFRGGSVGQKNREYKSRLGIVPQDLAIYEEISAEANVEFFASLYGLRGKVLRDSVNHALEFVGLGPRRKHKPSTFSGGMKRRLNIACAIAHGPDVIIMDEPTVGIDPQSRSHILDSIKALRDGGTTVIYTTHYMEEVEAISTRIAIMDGGRIIAEGTKEELKARIGDGRRYVLEIGGATLAPDTETAVTGPAGIRPAGTVPAGIDSAGHRAGYAEAAPLAAAATANSSGAAGEKVNGLHPRLQALYTVEGVKQVDFTGGHLGITTVPGIDNLHKIIAVLSAQGITIRHLTSSAVSLETVFLNLTGRSLRN